MQKINFGKLNPFSIITCRELIGIDFSTQNFKIVHTRNIGHKTEIIALLNQPIQGLADNDLAKLIEISINELKAKNPCVIVVVPAQLAITKNIEIPSVNPEEIKEIINLQAGRHTPYSREEIAIDYIDIGTYKHNYTKILLVLVPRSALKRQVDILDKAGISFEKILFAPEGLGRVAEQLLAFSSQASPVNLVHIDELYTDFLIIFREKAIFIRSIPIGAQQLINEKEKYLERFTQELRRSREAYQGEDIEKIPTQMILTGAVDGLRDLEVILNNTMPLPVKLLPYLKNLTVSEAALKNLNAGKSFSFLGLIATLAASEVLKVNLIPEEIKIRKALEERGRELIKTGILVLSSFVLLSSLFISKIYFKHAYLKKLNTKYQPLQREARELDGDFVEINLVKDYLARRGFSLEVLTELYNLVPQDMELTDIRYDEQGKFNIRGTTESMSTVFSFVESMAKSKYFQDVRTKYATKRKEGANNVTDFEIACVLNRQGR